jgi:hypothetical protein
MTIFTNSLIQFVLFLLCLHIRNSARP